MPAAVKRERSKSPSSPKAKKLTSGKLMKLKKVSLVRKISKHCPQLFEKAGAKASGKAKGKGTGKAKGKGKGKAKAKTEKPTKSSKRKSNK